MDYGRLSRKELQALCKEHGIVANKTNAFMAEALGAQLNAPKDSERTVELISDPAEVVKSRATRAGRSKKAVDELEASEVEQLSSQLAKSTLGVSPLGLGTSEVVSFIPEEYPPSFREWVLELMYQQNPSFSQWVWERLHYVQPEATLSFREYLLEAVFEFALEESFCELGRERLGERVPDQYPDSRFVYGLVLERLFEVVRVGEDKAPPAKAASKKSKAKGKKSKMVEPEKPVSPISLSVLEDAVVSAVEESLKDPASPTLGLANEFASREMLQRCLGPAPEELVFQPLCESCTCESCVEILPPGKPVEEMTEQCQHRTGTKFRVEKEVVSFLRKMMIRAMEMLIQAIGSEHSPSISRQLF